MNFGSYWQTHQCLFKMGKAGNGTFLLLFCIMTRLVLRVFLSWAHCTFQVLLKKSRHGPLFFLSPPPPSPSRRPPLARCSSEGHELKLPLGLPLWHPHRVGGVLRHLHDADRERLISLVDMVSHYLAGGRETTRGASTQPVLLRGHKGCGLHNSWGDRVNAEGGGGGNRWGARGGMGEGGRWDRREEFERAEERGKWGGAGGKEGSFMALFHSMEPSHRSSTSPSLCGTLVPPCCKGDRKYDIK